jgi:hypothetical protein
MNELAPEDYRGKCFRENKPANDQFREKVIVPLQEYLLPTSWKPWIEPLVVVGEETGEDGKTRVLLYLIHPPFASFVQEHYGKFIEELLEKPIRITNKQNDLKELKNAVKKEGVAA